MVQQIGRPVDLQRRAALLQRVVDYVLERGLSDLSLRPLARAAGCDPSVLAHHFGSKDELVSVVLNEVRGRVRELAESQRESARSPGERLRALWSWCAAPERDPLYRLFFEAYGIALQHPDRYRPFLDTVVADWLHWMADQTDETTATLAIAALRGLLLDLLATGDHVRTAAALSALADALDDRRMG